MPTTDLYRAKRGVAVLAACVVETLNESDPSFRGRFLEKMGQAYRKLKDGEGEAEDWGDVVQEMELLSWTRSLLTGFDFIKGQGEPFFK
jgi:hypothetical protein